MKDQVYIDADECVIAERDGFHVCIRSPEHGNGCTFTPRSTSTIADRLRLLNVRR
ncbi:hypothetical protein ACHIPZ_13760 [Antrihabitans sp. NCIMB 15449]|uniref:Uncharacterized protein n=1 Tax=Antrihabitans spumae TaxID=3373370 RepID=A0ABW7JMN5_9NOCA